MRNMEFLFTEIDTIDSIDWINQDYNRQFNLFSKKFSSFNFLNIS